MFCVVTLSNVPGYSVAKYACLTYVVWHMVPDTHYFGSSRNNHGALRDLLAFAQGKLSFAAYVKEMTSRFALVMVAYADPAHPGFLRSDLIQMAV